MAQITTKINEKILVAFRDVIYSKSGLRRGDLKIAIEDTMKDYIIKHRKKASVFLKKQL